MGYTVVLHLYFIMILMKYCIYLSFPSDGMISVTTAQIGESVTFSCNFSDSEYSNTRVKWYKQPSGHGLILITTLMKTTTVSTFEKPFSPSRFQANYTSTRSSLTILKTAEDDEAVYYCSVITWSKDEWSGTYLSIKGKNTRRTSGYTVTQRPLKSGQLHPRGSVSLQCSVLSETKTCPGDQSIHWFRAKSDSSPPNIIYSSGNVPHGCDKRPDEGSPPRNCHYHFNAYDAGTYYCALATCGEIIFGNGTKLDIEGNCTTSVFNLLFVTQAVSYKLLIPYFQTLKCTNCKVQNKLKYSNQECAK
uniref:Ig-like domain-containing protein n=1 Tax=Sphaeramia orbicularis TaxID=375764 RepID=A0A672ZPN3_9TELE